MNLKLFIEDNKGYTDTYKNVWSVSIKKIDNKNTLVIKYNSLKDDDYIKLNEIKLAFIVDMNTMIEIFRYER